MIEVDESLRWVDRTLSELGAEPEDAWLERQAKAIATGARLLTTVGSPAFLDHSRALYRCPSTASYDGKTTVLGLARHIDRVLGDLDDTDLGERPPACHLADGVAASMRAAVNERLLALEGVDEIFGQRLEECFGHFKSPFGQPDRPRLGSHLRDRTDLRNRKVPFAQKNRFSLAQPVKVSRQVSLSFVDVDPNHGFVLDQVVD